MTSDSMTFGWAIATARKDKHLSQKELAAKILKEDGTGPISPQYLNDIEHDRRSPTSDHLIRQFAQILEKDADYLFVLAGKIPEELKKSGATERQIVKGMVSFRRALRTTPKGKK